MRNLFIFSALIFVVVPGAAAGVVAMTLTSPHSLANSGYRVGCFKRSSSVNRMYSLKLRRIGCNLLQSSSAQIVF
jgi:hypothetical protein